MRYGVAQRRTLLALLLACALPAVSRAEVNEIRIRRQPGIIYMAPIVMEQQHLVERAAEALGLHGFTARYVTFGGGGPAGQLIPAVLVGC